MLGFPAGAAAQAATHQQNQTGFHALCITGGLVLGGGLTLLAFEIAKFVLRRLELQARFGRESRRR